MKCREILSNICDKKLCKNDLQLKTADYFQRIVTPLMPYRVLNKALDAEVNSLIPIRIKFNIELSPVIYKKSIKFKLKLMP